MSLLQEPPASATTSCTITDRRRRVCPACAVSCGNTQPRIICLSPLPELQCLTPCLAWIRQLVLMRPNSDVIRWSMKGVQASRLAPPAQSSGPVKPVIRWSMKGGASIPPCTSGTISGLTPAPGRPAQYTVPAVVIQAVCIAMPGFARLNVAYRLYSVDKLY